MDEAAPTAHRNKTCSACGGAKALDAFYRNSGAKDGRHAWCKTCVSAASKVSRPPKPLQTFMAPEAERRKLLSIAEEGQLLAEFPPAGVGGKAVDISGWSDRLLVLWPVGRTPITWLCICSCAARTVKTLRRGNLAGNRTRSCGCLAREIARETVREMTTLPAGEAGANKLYASYRGGAIGRGLPFHLTKAQFLSIVVLPCVYCGVCRQNVSTHREGGASVEARAHAAFRFTGIDRWINDEGYTPANCVPCCSDCNYLKRELDGPDFMRLLHRQHSFLRSADWAVSFPLTGHLYGATESYV